MAVDFASQLLTATLGIGSRKGKLARSNSHLRSGYHGLAGQYPAGLTSLEGVPTPARVYVRLRAPDHPEIDGALLGATDSAGDGTWYIGGLSPRLKYDVVGRMDNERDVTMSDVTPYPNYPRRVSSTGDVRVTTTGDVRTSGQPWPM